MKNYYTGAWALYPQGLSNAQEESDRRIRELEEQVERLKAPVSDDDARSFEREASYGWRYLQLKLDAWIVARAGKEPKNDSR